MCTTGSLEKECDGTLLNKQYLYDNVPQIILGNCCDALVFPLPLLEEFFWAWLFPIVSQQFGYLQPEALSVRMAFHLLQDLASEVHLLTTSSAVGATLLRQESRQYMAYMNLFISSPTPAAQFPQIHFLHIDGRLRVLNMA